MGSGDWSSIGTVDGFGIQTRDWSDIRTGDWFGIGTGDKGLETGLVKEKEWYGIWGLV